MIAKSSLWSWRKELAWTVLIAGVTLAFFLTTAFGQTPTPTDTPPSEPLIAPAAPAYSHWTITCAYVGGSSTSAKPAPVTGTNPRMLQDSIVKTDDTKYEGTVFEDGSKSEKWTKGSVIASKESGYPKISIHVGQPSGPSADFSDFDWLSKNNYAGKQKLDTGEICFVFQEQEYALRFINPNVFKAVMVDGVPTSDIGSKVPIIAYVDVETRLPVLMKIGKDLRTYQFLSPPASPLLLPDDYAAAVAQVSRQIQALTKPLSHP